MHKMQRVGMKGLTLTAICCGLIFGSARSVAASAFRVTPIRVTFDRSSKSALLTLVNDSTEELRFQITAFAWGDNEQTGDMKLTPTDDIVFFPSLLTLKPSEERKVRVGTAVGAAETEKTYRIFFEELPPLATAESTKGSQVKIITKMGIPIFIEPTKRATGGEITDLAMNNGKVAFNVKNSGNVHFIAQSVRVTGLDASGNAVVDKQREGWYVLPGTKRAYDLEFTPEECGKVKTVRVEVQTDLAPAGEPSSMLKHDFAVPPGGCAK